MKSFTLYFVEGTTDMTAESVPVLEGIRAEIAKRPGAEVQVTGHTDTVGSDSDNDALSKKRAEEILNLLASKGFDRAIMTAVGRGEAGTQGAHRRQCRQRSQPAGGSDRSLAILAGGSVRLLS